MNCNKARKYLFAFADSQLSVRANCEVLDHLKMCRACSAIVDEHQTIREALSATAGRIPIPHGLESRVRKAIQLGRPVPRVEGAGSLPRRPLLKRLAMAAAVGLAVTAVWQFGPWKESARSKGVVASMAPGKLASMILQRHNRCTDNCDRGMHHNKQLPRDRTLLAESISDHFNGRLAAAVPDLSDRGFRFHSANFCCIPDTAGCVSGHVMYANDENDTWLSFYSMPHWDDLPQNDLGVAPQKDNPFSHDLPSGDQRDAVVAWHQGDATYVCCGRMEASQMRAMVQDIRLALKDPHRREILAAFFGPK